MRGTTLIKIGGEDRHMKFGTNQSAEYCKVRGVSLAEAQKELSSVDAMDAGMVRDLLYSALFAGAKSEKEDVTYDRYEVGDWLDEMKQSELNKVFQTLVDSNNSGEDEGEDVSKKK